MKPTIERRPYPDIVSDFAESGAILIRQSISQRYKGLIPEGSRPLEPGFIPPDRQARVLIVSYFPNASDLDKPGTAAYERVRGHFRAWGLSGSVDDYRASYEDWLGYLDRIPFHKQRTKPILEAVGLRNEDIAWLPFVKAPMPAGSSPGDDIIDFDIEMTWEQIRLLRPPIVWIQGVKIADRVLGLVTERITDRVLPAQSLSRYTNAKKQAAEEARLIRRLSEFLLETT